MNDVPRETDRLSRLSLLILAENERQNLVSRAAADDFAVRHIEDSVQLAALVPRGTLIDIGSGGGLPGLVLACLRDDPVLLVEPRAKRAAFLREAAGALGLGHVEVRAAKIERVACPPAAAITARAVASLDRLFAIAMHVADDSTRWVLPKGRSVQAELEAARRSWQGDFELVQSRTDPDAAIVVAHRVRRRAGR